MAEASKTRALSGYWDIAVRIMLGGIALYYCWASTIGVVSLQYFRGIAILYSLILPLLLYKGWKRDSDNRPSVLDLMLAAGAAVVSVVQPVSARTTTRSITAADLGYPYPNAPDCNEQTGANCVAAPAWSRSSPRSSIS